MEYPSSKVSNAFTIFTYFNFGIAALMMAGGALLVVAIGAAWRAHLWRTDAPGNALAL